VGEWVEETEFSIAIVEKLAVARNAEYKLEEIGPIKRI